MSLHHCYYWLFNTGADMSKETLIQQSILHYLIQWHALDKNLCVRIHSDEKSERLVALREFSAKYRISRNFQRQYDEGRGKKRLEPALECLESVHCPESQESGRSQLIKNVQQLVDRLKTVYRQNNISAASKLYWLKCKESGIIFDALAKDTIITFSSRLVTDYNSYVDAWLSVFENEASLIMEKCKDLVARLQNPENETPFIEECKNINYELNLGFAYPQSISQFQSYIPDIEAPWFHRRVFDVYLWRLGYEKMIRLQTTNR